MTENPDTMTTRVWTGLIRAQRQALTTVETALKQAGLPPLSWYDALLELERGDPAGMRPRELEARLLLPQYGLSRLLDRLERAGYIARKPVPGDGRAQFITLTPEGHAVRSRMWPVYAGAIQEAVGDRLNEDERTVLAILLGKLAART